MSLSEDIKKPLNIVFLLLAIAGIVLSVFFYYNGRKTKSIAYYINEPSSLIYDSHNSSSAIKVIEKDSTAIRDNVYLLTGVIWNNGDIPVNTEDVRQTIVLNLESAKKILDFKIVRQTDPTVANFNLSRKDSHALNLSWKYFDPGYALKFQIIYTGTDNPAFNLNGKILDIKEFAKKAESRGPQSWIMLLCAPIALLFFIYTMIGAYKAQKEFKLKVNEHNSKSLRAYVLTFNILIVVFLAFGFIAFGFALFYLYVIYSTTIPFS
jgi:hypothetical protein